MELKKVQSVEERIRELLLKISSVQAEIIELNTQKRKLIRGLGVKNQKRKQVLKES